MSGEWLSTFALLGPIIFFDLFVLRDDVLRRYAEAFPAMANTSAFAALAGSIAVVLFSTEPTPWPILALCGVF